MFTHAPQEYKCPICLGIHGVESEDTLMKTADIVYQDDLVFGFINSFWIGDNKGHVIIVPKEHYENIFNIPDEVGTRLFKVSRLISLALKKAYNADGITIRQNNEPAGDQHAFHYHMHIFPRYDNDTFNQKMTEKSYLSKPEERVEYANKIIEVLKNI